MAQLALWEGRLKRTEMSDGGEPITCYWCGSADIFLSDKEMRLGICRNCRGTRKGALSDLRRTVRLRQAREKGTHTSADWEAVQRRYDYRCVRCMTPAEELSGGTLTKDHVLPIRFGGSDAADNLQPLCRNCNTAKEGDASTDFRVGFDERRLAHLQKGRV